MEPSNLCANIQMCNLERTFTYGGASMIALSVRYPKVTLCCNPAAQKRIHREIQKQVNRFYHYASNDLYQLAISDYQSSLENGAPFHRYDATLQYTITYNRNCRLSLYRDQYTYTGGAHGNTIRNSNTWSLESGQRIHLESLFSGHADYRTFLIREVTGKADERMQKMPGTLFENYRDLISTAFHEDRYYLTPSGIDIYYQEYEIAPYSTGIVVFTVPYGKR